MVILITLKQKQGQKMNNWIWIFPIIIAIIWFVDIGKFEYKQYKQRIKNDKR